MSVSLTGSRISMASVRSMLAGAAVVSGVAFYAYGPAVTPMMHAAAVSSCNQLTDGSYRNYQLQWVVDTRPHWKCWDLRDPAKPAVDMGWWVTPGR